MARRFIEIRIGRAFMYYYDANIGSGRNVIIGISLSLGIRAVLNSGK